MITPGLAYAIGYESYRLAAVQAVKELLARLARNASVMANPKVKHAVEFATKGAAIEQKIAAEKATAVVARAHAAGVSLPEVPGQTPDAPSWIAAVEAQLKPELQGDAAVALQAGRAAAALMEAWTLAEKLAYLRASAPDQHDLSAEAAQVAAKMPELTQRVQNVLAGIHRPMVARKLEWLRDWFGRAPQPDVTSSPTYESGYAHIVNWKKHTDGLLTDLDQDFDVPIDPKPTSEPTPEEQQLFAEILQRPFDYELRRRYAELAAKRQDPRAELIRAQIAIRDLEARRESLGPLRERVQELLVSHPEWTAALRELGARDIKFDRGFPWEITIDVTPFLEHADKLFALAPITSVRLRGGLGRGAALAALPLLAKLGALDLEEQGVTDSDIAALATSPYVSGLRFLGLIRNRLTDAGIETLVASTNLPALERVALDFNPGADPVDQLEYYNETQEEPVPTDAGRALEQKYGPKRWFHPYERD